MCDYIIPDNTLVLLTEREKKVLCLIAQGATCREIGYKLGISHETADTHRENIKKKLHAGTVADLVQCVIVFGLIKPRCPQEVNRCNK